MYQGKPEVKILSSSLILRSKMPLLWSSCLLFFTGSFSGGPLRNRILRPPDLRAHAANVWRVVQTHGQCHWSRVTCECPLVRIPDEVDVNVTNGTLDVEVENQGEVSGKVSIER